MRKQSAGVPASWLVTIVVVFFVLPLGYAVHRNQKRAAARHAETVATHEPDSPPPPTRSRSTALRPTSADPSNGTPPNSNREATARTADAGEDTIPPDAVLTILPDGGRAMVYTRTREYEIPAPAPEIARAEPAPFRAARPNFDAPADRPVAWQTAEQGLGPAQQLAARDGRPLLVYVYTDWCRYCRELEANWLQHPDADRILARSVVRVRVNPERSDTERAISREFGVRSYPTLLLVEGQQSRRISAPLGQQIAPGTWASSVASRR